MSDTRVFLAQKDDGLTLVVDELDEVAVTVLGLPFGQLSLALDDVVVDADLVLLHQFLHESMPQRDVLCARTVGAVAGDVQRRRVVGVRWHAAEALIEAQLQYRHVGAAFRRTVWGRSMASLKVFENRSNSPHPEQRGCLLVVVWTTSAANASALSRCAASGISVLVYKPSCRGLCGVPD